MSLNSKTNKYCCVRCGAGGYSIGLYAKIRNIDNKKAFIELLKRDCFTLNTSPIEINPINELADVQIRDTVYRDFLSKLKLDEKHNNYLKSMGFLDSSIKVDLYKSVPKKYIKRRLISSSLARNYNLCGIPGFYQEEDFHWSFSKTNGFYIPIFDENGYIKALSIHLDKQYNNTSDIWFSSNNKINGTSARNYIMKHNITEYSDSILLTDNFLIGNLIKEITNMPTLAFQNISNSYMILREIQNTNIRNITFVLKTPESSKNLDYITNRIFKDLLPLGYNLNIKHIKNYKDFFEEDFNVSYALAKTV